MKNLIKWLTEPDIMGDPRWISLVLCGVIALILVAILGAQVS